MRKLFFIPILLFSLLLGTTSYAGDIQKGANAYFNNDYATALKEFKPLAEEGNTYAQVLLGVMYDLGQGVPQDLKEAVRLWRLAAEQGTATAQNNLASMYAKGQGVIQDFVYAHMWWNISASNGDETAKNSKNILEKEMTPSQIEEAQRLARECVKKNYKGC